MSGKNEYEVEEPVRMSRTKGLSGSATILGRKRFMSGSGKAVKRGVCVCVSPAGWAQDLPDSPEKNGVMGLLPHNRGSLKEMLRVCDDQGVLQRKRKETPAEFSLAGF